jgi:hypothetical protein
MSRAVPWSEEELEIVASNPAMTAVALMPQLPGRSAQAIGNMRRSLGVRAAPPAVEPPVKAAGDYLETVSAYLADDFECMQIWLKWNGYASYRELNRDLKGMFGHVTILATAK